MYRRMSPNKVLRMLKRIDYFYRRQAFYATLTSNPTIDEMVSKARELGLELNIEVKN